MSWTKDKTITFLELYALERVLWDPSNKNHKLKRKVQDAWERISENMENEAIEDLKRKKKSLMATFRPLLKKKTESIKSGAGVDDVCQPMWFAYEYMESFLGNLYAVEETTNTEYESEDENEIPPPTPMQIEDQDDKEEEEKQLKKKHVVKKIKACVPNKRTHIKYEVEEVQTNINDSFDTSNRVSNANQEDDDCELYTKLLAKKLRKYPEYMRHRLMYQIDGLIFDNPYPTGSTISF